MRLPCRSLRREWCKLQRTSTTMNSTHCQPLLRTAISLLSALLLVSSSLFTFVSLIAPSNHYVTLFFIFSFLFALSLSGLVRSKALTLFCVGGAVVCLMLSARLFGRNNRVRAFRLPSQQPVHLFSRFLPEEIGVYTGTLVGPYVGLMTEKEYNGLLAILNTSYRELRASRGYFPSPLYTTPFGSHTEKGFDLLVLDPGRSARGSLLFLHGAGGNFTLLCGVIAEAAAHADLKTYCPSMRLEGRWHRHDGRAILEKSIDFIRKDQQRGPLFVAGLSNGAAGAQALSAEYSTHFTGLILLYGYQRGVQDSVSTNFDNKRKGR